jgi:hypothetical protein
MKSRPESPAMKSKKSFAKATCDHCGQRVEVDAAPLLLSGKSTVACPNCGKEFAVSLAGARPGKKRETAESARRTETAGSSWETEEMQGQRRRAGADQSTNESRREADPAPELPVEEENVELPFQPLLSQSEETRGQSRKSARVPFAPIQATPAPTPSTPAAPAKKVTKEKPATPEKPAEPKSSSFYQWVIIFVSITLIAIGLYFLPLGNSEGPAGPKEPPPQNGDPENPTPDDEDTVEILDPALFDPPVPEVQLPELVSIPNPTYPFPDPALARWEP